MNRYKKGADVERQAVTDHIKNGALLAGRFAGSKCKGKLKVDVVALYPQNKFRPQGILVLEQYKKGKQSVTKEKKKFLKTKLPMYFETMTKFIQVK